MVSLAAVSKPIPENWNEKPIQKMMTQVGICGLHSHNGYVSNLERQGFPTCRFQEHGTREIIAIDIIGLVEYATVVGKIRRPEETYFTWLERTIDSINSAADMEKFQELKIEILRATLGPWSFCYVPAGWIIAEKAVGEAHSHSLRTPTLDNTEKTLSRLKNMIEQAYVSDVGADGLKAVWDEYLTALAPADALV